RPTSLASISSLMSLISALRTETISSAFDVMACTLEELVPDFDEPRAHGAVEEPVADLDDEAAEHVGVDDGVEDRFAAEHLAQPANQAVALRVTQRHGTPDLDPHLALALLAQVDARDVDGAEQVEAVVVVEHQDEFEKARAGPRLQPFVNEGCLAVSANREAGE